jgi:precorrin-6A/cobalt-precorrin-6A reductase
MPTMDSQRGDGALCAEFVSSNGSLPTGMSRILILGGTTEARELAERLASRADLEIVMSLAGRTKSPAPQPARLRSGGFGGAARLADYLRHEKIDALVDATHPYANIISGNAVAAARRSGVPLITLRRSPWPAHPGDLWTEAVDVTDAVRLLGDRPRRVFVTLGRTELAPLTSAPQHFYLIRSVDPVDPPLPLPRVSYITDRGPFSEAGDRALMRAHQIDTLIAKNSGGLASYGKIAAARTLGIAVLMLRRPLPPDAPAVETVEQATAWLDHALASVKAGGDIARGV